MRAAGGDPGTACAAASLHDVAFSAPWLTLRLTLAATCPREAGALTNLGRAPESRYRYRAFF
jgi:hypothetical protein